MPRTKLIQDRGATRPRQFTGSFGTVTFTAPEQNAKTWAVGPTGMRGLLDYGPSVPGPFVPERTIPCPGGEHAEKDHELAVRRQGAVRRHAQEDHAAAHGRQRPKDQGA